MFFAVIGLIIVIIGFIIGGRFDVMALGLAFFLFDLVIEIANLKSQIYHVGVALRDALREIKKEIKEKDKNGRS